MNLHVPRDTRSRGEPINHSGTLAYKKEFKELIVITDVCLCGYTSHGHCGVVRSKRIDLRRQRRRSPLSDFIDNDETIKKYEAVKAFFLNDPRKSLEEISDLRQIDIDRSGTIDMHELMMLRKKKVRLSFADKLLELFSTHPNTLKRIKYLSTLYDRV